MYPRIRDLREDTDLSQVKFAKLLGMSQTGYSKYETGENDIPTEILIALAHIHHTSTDYLLGLTQIISPMLMTSSTLATRRLASLEM